MKKFNKKDYSEQEIAKAKEILINFYNDILMELKAEQADEEEIERTKAILEFVKNL